MSGKIYAVYVTYNPSIDIFERSLESIAEDVTKIFVIDNGSINGFRSSIRYRSNMELIIMQNNMGIGYSQNIGIRKAIAEQADFILLSDQDTVFPQNYVQNMVSIFDSLENLAAVAPRFIDSNKNGEDGFIGTSPFRFRRIFPKKGLHEVMQVISSGKVLNTKYLSDIGLFDSRLFIDWVDLEWCWRATKRGYRIMANASVVIDHCLGESSVNIGFREINLRNYARHYYITRNAFYLSLYSKNLNIMHRVTLFISSFRYLIGFPMLAKPHSLNLKYVVLAFLHGITGKLGKLQ